MQLLLRKRWLTLLLPVLWPLLALLLAAGWLGYSLAVYSLVQVPVDSMPWGAVAVLPALGCALVAGGWLLRAAHQVFVPWVQLAQAVQQRAPKDLRPMELTQDAPLEVQAMTEALNQLFARAHAESDAQQRFIADAAHQLRTPLAALQSQVEAWALMAQAAPQQSIHLPAEQVQRLRKASRRTTQLANQLLALSRVDSGLEPGAAPQRVDLQSLCETLLASFLDRALAKELDLGLEAEAAHVSGHEWLLRELISNLLDNAIKYTPAGGQVTLRCGKRPMAGGAMRAYVEVDDDGPGVAEGEYTRLTQRFYRVPGSAGEGTGLGLAIAQEIAQTHHAHLSFGAGHAQRGLKAVLQFGE